MTLYENPPGNRERGDSPVHVSPVTPSEDARTVLINTLSWSAVFGGVVAMLVIQLLLNMLGVGIGLGMVEPWSSDTAPDEAIPVAAGLWWVVSGIIASLLGAMLAGRLSGRPKESTAGWHGITAWAFSTLVIVALAGSVLAGIIGGAVSLAGPAMGGLGEAVGEAAVPVIDRFRDEVSTSNASATEPGALQEAAVSAVVRALTAEETEAADTRERAAQALSRAQGIPIEQARGQVDDLKQRYDAAMAEAETEAAQLAEAAAEAGSRFALYSFAALVLGAVAAWFGGRWGMVRPTVTADVVEVRSTR